MDNVNERRAVYVFGVLAMAAVFPVAKAWTPPLPAVRCAHAEPLWRLGGTAGRGRAHAALRAEGGESSGGGEKDGGADDASVEKVRGIARAKTEFDGFERLRQQRR